MLKIFKQYLFEFVLKSYLITEFIEFLLSKQLRFYYTIVHRYTIKLLNINILYFIN